MGSIVEWWSTSSRMSILLRYENVTVARYTPLSLFSRKRRSEVSMTETIKGTCNYMCPEKERRMREREGLLHKFEIDESTKHMKKPKADPNKIVKCFGRPAAGQVKMNLDQLRPASVLLKTINYLFTKIVTRTDVNWVQVYDFVFDRLRAIRQDIVIQRIDTGATVKLLEPIVSFHVYAAQRLCECNISEYDPKINEQHLAECIKYLLVLYDKQDRKYIKSHGLQMDKIPLDNNRIQMEALYILLYIGDSDALKRVLNLPKILKNTPEIQLAMKISLAWYLRNYVRVFSLVEKLSPLLVCAVMTNLKSLRRNALQIMSWGFNSSTLKFPGCKLQQLLLYKDITRLQADCELLGLKFTQGNILFQKSQFKNNVLLANSEMYYSTKMLQSFLPQILLMSN